MLFLIFTHSGGFIELVVDMGHAPHPPEQILQELLALRIRNIAGLKPDEAVYNVEVVLDPMVHFP